MSNIVAMSIHKINNSASQGSFQGKPKLKKVNAAFEILEPIQEKAYPISLARWSAFKKSLSNIKDSNPLYYIVGSILLTTAISIVITAVIESTISILCLLIATVCLLIGIVLIARGYYQKKEQEITITRIIEDMEELESQFRSASG